MMKGILFEDLYKYTNKYWKDVKSRHVRPTTKTLADIAKASPKTYNRVKADLMPFPGDHLIEQLGNAFKNISDATYLINQLFDNPAIHLDKKIVKSATLKLQKIQDLIKSVSEDLDHDDSDS
tara:strand:+ start:661 stop:1026 length:366 start_codon:yes stop_codon:yes gene_type:complete